MLRACCATPWTAVYYGNVHSNQDLTWCVKIGACVGFWIDRGFWILWLPEHSCGTECITLFSPRATPAWVAHANTMIVIFLVLLPDVLLLVLVQQYPYTSILVLL